MRFPPWIVISFSLFLSCLPRALADPDRWLQWEQQRNDWYLNPSVYAQMVSPEQKDRLSKVDFVVEAWVPAEKLGMVLDPQWEGQINSDFVRTGRSGKKEIRFLMHPDAVPFFKDQLGELVTRRIPAKPTASFRTFLVSPHMVKVSLPEKMSGAQRMVYSLQMERAVSISKLLSRIPVEQSRSRKFGFLPEVAGVHLKNEQNPYGFIVREIPEEILKGKNTLVPLFSFFAKPPEGPEGGKGESLFHDWIVRNKGDALQMTREQLLKPLVESYLFAYFEHGVLVEAHQQNTLLEIDGAGNPTGRIFYRDLDGARVNPKIREKRGLSNSFLNEVSNPDWVFDLQKVNSLAEKKIKGAGANWDGLLDYGFRTHLEGSNIHLMERALKRDFPKEAKGVQLGWRVRKLVAEEAEKFERLSARPCGKLFNELPAVNR